MSTFAFTVPTKFFQGKPTEWLGVPDKDADGKVYGLTDAEDTALRFVFRVHSTMADDLRIEQRLDSISGGVGHTVDLEEAKSRIFQRISENLTAMVWPEGRPKAKDPDAQKAQNKEMNDLHMQIMREEVNNDEASIVRRHTQALDRINSLYDTLWIAAAWPVLSERMPEGWDDLSKMSLPDRVKLSVREAFSKARAEALESSGKS